MKVETKQLAKAYVEITKGLKGSELEHAANAFVQVLAQRGEIHRYRDIVLAIDRIWKEEYGAANLTIATAHPLTKKLKESLEKLAQGAALKEEVDPELIGGAKLRIDDRIIDGSIRGHLLALKQRLSEVT